MSLRLEIVSHHRVRLGERRYKEFGAKGGTIGRSLESDWALEDSKRYLSGRHAAIDFRSGSYYLVDTSTNGVYVNDSPTPIGRGKPQRLFNGDRLRLGEYVMVAHIDEAGDKERFETGEHVDPVERAQQTERAESTGYTLLSEDELSAIAVEEILADDSATDALRAAAIAAASGLRLVDDDTAGQRSARPPAGADGDTASRPRPDASTAKAKRPQRPADRGGAQDAEPAARQPAEIPAPAPSPAAEPARKRPAAGRAEAAAPQAALNAFLRGAGVEPRQLGTAEAAVLLQRAGQLVRELTVGLRTLIDVRVEHKNTLRLANTTIQPRGNNLLKFAASDGEALENLLFARKTEYLSAVESVREAFDETAVHEQALLEAAHAALLDYLERLDPEEIREKCAEGGKRGLLGALGDSNFRNRYSEIYAALAEHTPGHLPSRFTEVLASVYEQEVAKRAASARPKPVRATAG